MKSYSCSSSYYTKQVRVVGSLAQADSTPLSKRTQSNPQILNFINYTIKYNPGKSLLLLQILVVKMKLLHRQHQKIPKQLLPATPKGKKRRGISLSYQKQGNFDENKENRSYVVSQKKAVGESKSKIANFIIFDMDRNQWQRSKKQYLRSNMSKMRYHVIQPTTLKNTNQARTIQSFTNSIEFPPTQSFLLQNSQQLELGEINKPKSRGRAREIRSRINQIQQRLNILLEASKIS